MPMWLVQLKQKSEALTAAEAKLRGQQEYAASLQDNVRLEQERIATFTGRNTDKCTSAELNVLACVHEDALTRVRAQLVSFDPLFPHPQFAGLACKSAPWWNSM